MWLSALPPLNQLHTGTVRPAGMKLYEVVLVSAAQQQLPSLGRTCVRLLRGRQGLAWMACVTLRWTTAM
jgi:hypothetical protein